MQDSLPATMSVGFLHPFFDELLRRGTTRAKLATRNVQHATLAERVHQLIERRISEPDLGVERVAKGVGLKSWKLQSLLKAEGMSVSSIKDDVRRKRAIDQVAGTTDSVASIAAHLGYTNVSNFTRAFRSWTGLSPRGFRKTR